MSVVNKTQDDEIVQETTIDLKNSVCTFCNNNHENIASLRVKIELKLRFISVTIDCIDVIFSNMCLVMHLLAFFVLKLSNLFFSTPKKFFDSSLFFSVAKRVHSSRIFFAQAIIL